MSSGTSGTGLIDTDEFSLRLRNRAIRPAQRQLLITNLRGSDQEKDLTVPANCNGYGRIRHFRRLVSPGWPINPLPIDPATHALGLERTDTLEAQLFQNAACNWRCWYCYVPFELLNASPSRGDWFTARELVDLYMREPRRPHVIDLSGGQPDLTPEWIVWTIQALRESGLDQTVYLWSDDNLSNDYYFRFLTDADRELIASTRLYGRVCCFKGFNEDSFSFNTRADPSIYSRQFQIFSRLLAEGLDLFAYVTLTTPTPNRIREDMARFVDKLQSISPLLPLRTVPLEIQIFSPVASRVGDLQAAAINNQAEAKDAWLFELQHRFSSSERAAPIYEHRLRPNAMHQ
jgi:uncharacterized Fe-S cluster-containing radical SAM superfamily protein